MHYLNERPRGLTLPSGTFDAFVLSWTDANVIVMTTFNA